MRQSFTTGLRWCGVLVAAAAVGMLTAAQPAQAQAPAGYTLSWSDEFNGAVGSSPSSANWNIDTGTGSDGWGNYEMETYSSAAANLEIVSDSAATDGKALAITATDVGGVVNSGRIDSIGKLNPTFGYIEVRAKNPTGTGFWPAFWMLGTDYTTAGWPNCGEQDIMELFAAADGTNMGSWHMTYDGSPITWTADYTLAGGATFSQAYHTFGMEWTQQAVTDYVDGVEYETHAASDSPGWIFNHTFYYILNLAVGGDTGAGTPTASQFPQTLDVDYVRLYTTTVGTSPGASPATDACNDFTVTYNTSGNWTIDTSNTAYFNNDPGRFCRTYDGTEFVNYKYPNASKATATIYTYQPDNSGTTAVTVWYSTNGGSTYTESASTSSTWTATEDSWGYYTLTSTGTWPSGVTDVKLQLAATTVAWDTEIGSVTVTFGAATVPSAPTGVTATAGSAQVALAWTASSGATSYNVFRGTTSGGESTTAIATGITTTSFTNTGLTNGTKYYFTVKALNSAGTSAASSEVSATPVAAVPAAPTGLTATAGSAQVALSWTADSSATSYNVYRGTTSGGESATAIATGITATTYTNTGLTNGTTYYYKVAGVDSAGTSALSGEVSATPAAGTGGTYGGTWKLSPYNATSLYLYASGSASGDAVEADSTSSSWVTTDTGVTPAGFYTFTLSGYGVCLDASGATTASKVEVYTCNGSSAQSWSIQADGAPAGYYQISPDNAPGIMLDNTGTTSGSAVEIITDNSSNGQQWTGL